jgi:hypothetical protein
MLRLLIGLRILRGPKPSTPIQALPASGRRRVLLGICCVLAASAGTHSGAGRAATPSPIANARVSIARHIQDPAALFFIATETRRVLGHVDRVDLSFGVNGSDFSAVVLYKPLSGDLTGQVVINRLPEANLSAEEKGCRVRGHKVTRVKIGRYHAYYCGDDITFGCLWRWDHRIYTVESKCRVGGGGGRGRYLRPPFRTARAVFPQAALTGLAPSGGSSSPCSESVAGG